MVIFTHVKCAQNELYYHSEHVFGVSKNTKDHYLGLHCTGEMARDSHVNS